MDPFEYPTHEGGTEVAKLLGVDPQTLMSGQDWEYTSPNLSHLDRYRELYLLPGTSNLAKRVLGCFIFQCMEDHVAQGGLLETVEMNLARLSEDYAIHRCEFEYWSCFDDSHYTEHPEDGFLIMETVRKIMRQKHGADSI
jgi:hypothetical protein